MFHRALSIAAFAIAALIPAPLFAQAIPVPPTRELIDGNGVDLFRGTYTVDETVASLGGSDGISLRRIARGSSNFIYNVQSYLRSSGTVYTATLNGRTDRFTKSGSTYTPTEANGSSLTYNGGTQIYTYTARDGTVATFSEALLPTGNYQPYGNEGVVTSIVAPNGESYSMSYESQIYCVYYEGDFCTGGYQTARRVSSISGPFGFLVHPTYFWDDLEDGSYLLNWYNVVDYKLINPAVENCTTSCVNNWPSTTNPNRLVNGYVSANGVITGVRRPGSASNDVTITYTSGKVSAVADHAGSTSYAYSDNAGLRTVTVTNALSQVSTHTFTITSERLASFKDALNNITSYTYDGSGRLTRITRPEGNYTNFTYDARGNVTETRHVAKPGSGIADIVTTAAFPGTCTNFKTCNQPTSTTDARGAVTDYTYDSGHGGVLTITAPAPTVGATRPKRTITYVTQSGITLPASVSQCATLASCTGGADEIKSVVTYGTTGGGKLQPTQVASGNGTGALTATTQFAYDIYGNLTAVDGPLAGADDTTTAIYDPGAVGSPGIRRVIGTISPDPDGAGGRPRLARRLTFATSGDLTKSEVGSATGTSLADLQAMTVAQGVDYAYDGDGRKLKESLTSPPSNTYAVTQYGYDAAGRPTCAAQRMNPAEWASLPADACLADTAGSFGPDRITKTVRDANGRPTQVQVAFGVAGEQANERTLGYSANGQVSHLIDANVNRTTYEYDGHDRLVKTRFPITTIGADSSSTTDYEQLALDPNGYVTTRRLRDGQNIGYTYDALNRLTNKDLPGTEPDATYAYDLVGRMTSAVQNSITNAMTWDALGRMLTESAPQGTVTSEYDLAGRRTKVTLPGATTLYADYLYDLLNNVTFIRENGATSGVGVLATYQYDSFGRRSNLTFGNGAVQSYAYDNAARLATQTTDLTSTANDLTQTFSYNPSSQITSLTRSNDLYAWTGHTNENMSSTPNGLNQIGNVGAKTVTHDSKGNITAVGTDGYGYSSENFLTSGPASTTLAYDPMGRLYQVASGGTTTRLGYDGLDRIAEYDDSNAIQRRYLHGPGVDEPLVWYEGSGTTTRRFLNADERGSIIAVTDSAGAVLGLNKYDEYGVPQATNLGKFGYTGQAWVPEVGLWYYKARFYRPDIGRFLQTDPIGYGGGTNMYAYVGNDPANGIDPFGLDCEGQPDVGECAPIIVTASAGLEDVVKSMMSFANQWFVGNRAYILSFVNSGVAWCMSNPQLCGQQKPKPQSGHSYDTTEKICNVPLSAGQRGQINRATALPDGTISPGRTAGTYPVGGSLFGIIPMIGGYVTTRFSADGNIAVNTTTSAHLFVGTIERTIYSNSGGTFIRTTGSGNAGGSAFGRARDSLNETMGPGIFREQNALSRIYASRLDPSC